MTDEKNEYFDEVKEKSIVARSAKAYAQKPKHRYTKKELNAMNGPTHSVNPKKYIPYEAFKALPDSLKKTYLESVITTWHIGAAAIARMWGITAGTVSPMLKRLGVKASSTRTNKAGTDRFFAEFVNADGSVAPTKKTMSFSGSSVCFTGIYDERSLLSFLKNIVPREQQVRIQVTVAVTE
jgi:hypothetical protein